MYEVNLHRSLRDAVTAGGVDGLTDEVRVLAAGSQHPVLSGQVTLELSRLLASECEDPDCLVCASGWTRRSALMTPDDESGVMVEMADAAADLEDLAQHSACVQLCEIGSASRLARLSVDTCRSPTAIVMRARLVALVERCATPELRSKAIVYAACQAVREPLPLTLASSAWHNAAIAEKAVRESLPFTLASSAWHNAVIAAQEFADVADVERIASASLDACGAPTRERRHLAEIAARARALVDDPACELVAVRLAGPGTWSALDEGALVCFGACFSPDRSQALAVLPGALASTLVASAVTPLGDPQGVPLDAAVALAPQHWADWPAAVMRARAVAVSAG